MFVIKIAKPKQQTEKQRREVYDPLHLANVKGKTINFINILYPKIKFTFISFLQLNVTFEIPLHFSLLDILRSKK